jgi:AhpD family alkylhydroperoxidase
MDLTGDATFIEVSGNNPDVYNWYFKDFYKKLFYSGRIETTLVELVRLRLANVHGCAFCNKGDTAHALKSGITQTQIDALNDYQSGPFSAREKLALEFSDQMVLNNQSGHIDKDLYGRAKNEFTDGEIYELGMIMAVLVGVAKFTFVFDLVEKEDYCKF